MKRKRYEEDEERRRRRRKMKRKRYYADMPTEEEEASRKKADIPMDVLVDILSRLPARCVWRLRSVCKDWKSQIESPSFADLQLRRGSKEEKPVFMFGGDGYGYDNPCPRTRFYSIDYKYGKAVQALQEFLHPTETRTVSINGLVCYYGTDGEIKVCNPVTRELIHLPKPTFLLSSHQYTTSYLDIGIGFDSTSKTYKLLAIYGEGYQQVEIFTLGGTQGWRKLQLPSPTTYIDSCDGLCANGCAFWFTADYHNSLGEYGNGDISRALMTFDFAQEKFEFVPLPPDIETLRSDHLIRELGGHLCLIQAKYKRKKVKLWTLAPNSPTKLWAHHHTVLPHSQDYTCLPCLFPVSSGVMEYDFFERTKRIFFYNEQGRVVKSIKVRDIPSRFCPLQLYSESLVSLRKHLRC